MEDRQLVIGGFYKHFKGKLYQVKAVAYHSETKEKMVVYQALYGSYSMYVRPFEMFMSEVDHEKYPQAEQRYRFEQIELSDEVQKDDTESAKDIRAEEAVEALDKETEDIQEGQVNPYLLRFLDAESYTEKLNVLAECRDKLDDKLINAMAASMEIEVPEGTINQRYASLQSCIRTHARYEGSRLR